MRVAGATRAGQWRKRRGDEILESIRPTKATVRSNVQGAASYTNVHRSPQNRLRADRRERPVRAFRPEPPLGYCQFLRLQIAGGRRHSAWRLRTDIGHPHAVSPWSRSGLTIAL